MYHQSNGTVNLANLARFDCACQLNPQKDNVEIKKIFHCFWLSMRCRPKYMFSRGMFITPMFSDWAFIIDVETVTKE